MLAAPLLALLLLAQAPPPAQANGIAALLGRIEEAVLAGDRAGILALAAPGAVMRPVEEFAATLTSPVAARVVVKERDRTAGAADRARLLVEIFIERGIDASLGTWMIEVAPGASPADLPVITEITRLSVVSGLYRLSLNPATQYSVHNLTVRAPDMTLEMSSGSAFVAETGDGPTAIVLLGRGRMHFAPKDAAEQTQVRIFGGDDALTTEFDAVFIRVRPSEFTSLFPTAALRAREVDPRALRRAVDVFDEYIGRTLQIDLSDLSRDRWSLTPQGSDVIAEIRTRRFGSLTYTRSAHEAEDIALFDRRRRRNIAAYASVEKLATRGRFYSEDDLVDYDVLAYDLDVAITPDRATIEGTSRVKLRIRAASVQTLNLRLAETLTVRSVSSPQFGRLLHLRVVGQNSLIVNLPATVVQQSEFWISVTYAGRVPPQSFDREAIAIGQETRENYVPLEPHYIYSNRSYWYPQSTVTDYASATLRISVPAGLDVVATGQPTGPPAPPPGVADASTRGRRVFVFEASEPVRYLSCVISRFNEVDTRQVVPPTPGTASPGLSLLVQANPRQTGRARELAGDAETILHYFTSLVGSAPYPSFTIAATESDRPGGHSPPYFAVLNQVVASSDMVWRNDPVSFDNYPLFFLAHEIAHQWWGHAIGWKNYHEQWISEGFAQYFALLFAEKQRGDALMLPLLRQMRHTAITASAQGPIHLGYRLGHIRGDDRVYRSIIYNKGAMVLHMLRRLMGDEAFFKGLRAFYEEWQFRKAGTDDFRRVMEVAAERDLSRFFELWVYGTSVPVLQFDADVTGATATLRFEAREPVDVAVTVTITYVSGRIEHVVVPVLDKAGSRTVPLAEGVRSIVANADNAALVTISR